MAEDTRLDEIVMREMRVKADLLDPNITEIDVGQFTMAQLGLSFVVCGRDGRMWQQAPQGGKLKLIGRIT